MQGELKVNLVAVLADARPRHRLLPDLGADAAFLAKVKEIRGQPVAGVNHGGRDGLVAQNSSDSDSRIGKEMAREQLRFQVLLGIRIKQAERGGGTAQFAGDVDAVSRASA